MAFSKPEYSIKHYLRSDLAAKTLSFLNQSKDVMLLTIQMEEGSRKESQGFILSLSERNY